MGDLSDQWHTRQMALLNQHVTLINIYNMALDTLDVAAHSGNWRKGGSGCAGAEGGLRGVSGLKGLESRSTGGLSAHLALDGRVKNYQVEVEIELFQSYLYIPSLSLQTKIPLNSVRIISSCIEIKLYQSDYRQT